MSERGRGRGNPGGGYRGRGAAPARGRGRGIDSRPGGYGGGGGGGGGGDSRGRGSHGSNGGAAGNIIGTWSVNRKPDKSVNIPYIPQGVSVDSKGKPEVEPTNPDVEKKEAEYAKSSPSDISRLNVADSLPYRPGYGTSGKAMTVYANFFEVTIEQGLILGQYSIRPPAELANKKRKRTEIVAAAIKLLPNYSQFRQQIATDYAGVLISVGAIRAINDAPRVEIDGISKSQLDVDVPDIAQAGTETEKTSADATKTWRVTFRVVNGHRFSEILGYLNSATGAHRAYDNKFEIMQVLNIFLGHHARESEAIFNKSSGQRNKLFHRETERQEIGGGLEALKGFISSVRFAAGRILLNVNNASIACYKATSLWNLMVESQGAANPSYAEAERFIKGIRIECSWLNPKTSAGNARQKSVWGFAKVRDQWKRIIDGKEVQTVQVRINFAGPEDVQFMDKGGNWITVGAYFRKNYPNATKWKPTEPVVNLGSSTRPIYAPMQLCHVLFGQDYRQKLDGKQTQGMLNFAVNQPWFNFKYIEQRAPPVLGLDSVLLQRAGIKITPKLILVSARLLEPPTVIYGGDKSVRVAEGGWSLRGGTKLRTGAVPPKDWQMVFIDGTNGPRNPYLDGTQRETTPQGLALKFSNAFKDIGIDFKSTIPVSQIELALRGSEAALDEELQGFFEHYAKTSSFLLIILPAKLPEWQYKRLKYWADIKYGIATICMAGPVVRSQEHHDDRFLQYATNIGLKVNCKLGGTNHEPDRQKLKGVAGGKTMLVGLDVTHPAPGSRKTANSVAAMVANINGSLSQWPATLELNGERVEEVSTIEKMLISRLDLWRTKGNNVALPENIMFFRDGVSEGQFKRVLGLELPQIRNAVKKKYGQGKPPNLFIAVCGKRHQVRFAPTMPDQCDSGNNLKAGLVVDSGITETRMWDFYLQAHKAIQGHARSCHYTVLYDEIFSNPRASKEFGRVGVGKADVLQEICHALAYTYPRATKAVSLSTPAKLADLACDRARAYISKFIDSPATADDGSSVSSAGVEAANKEQAAAITVHLKLKDTMFYI